MVGIVGLEPMTSTMSTKPGSVGAQQKQDQIDPDRLLKRVVLLHVHKDFSRLPYEMFFLLFQEKRNNQRKYSNSNNT